MINGKATDFIECLSYEDNYAIFRQQKFFFNGCQTQKDTNGKTICVRLEVYNLTNHSTVFSTTQNSISDCLSAFQDAKIWDGKTFWEVEQEIEWIDN